MHPRRRLRIERESKATHIGATLGPLKKVGDAFEFEAKDFLPDRELTVLFANE
jgi:hypothetical protein